jgi:hypothetical protein
MTLSSMVVSRDWQEVSVLECILGGLHMDVTVENEPQRALTKLSRSKIDALIVDRDLNGSTQLLRELQTPTMQMKTVPLVIMGGPPDQPATLDATGALFAFEKPISVEQAVRTLSAARNMIVDGRLRYHRAGIEIPVSLKCKGRKPKDAELVNLSQGGMQLHIDTSLEAARNLQISFALPGARSGLKAHAEIVWQDQRGNVGVRFLKVPQPQQRTLQLWLAQQFLAN